jgi:hypothetical protein
MSVRIYLSAGRAELQIRDTIVQVPNSKELTLRALGDVLKVYLFAPVGEHNNVLDARAARILHAATAEQAKLDEEAKARKSGGPRVQAAG